MKQHQTGFTSVDRQSHQSRKWRKRERIEGSDLKNKRVIEKRELEERQMKRQTRKSDIREDLERKREVKMKGRMEMKSKKEREGEWQMLRKRKDVVIEGLKREIKEIKPKKKSQ